MTVFRGDRHRSSGAIDREFCWDDEHVTAAVRHVARAARVVRPAERLALLADEPDNRILECAREAKAELIITGDRHLLDLGEFEGIRIVTLANFYASTSCIG